MFPQPTAYADGMFTQGGQPRYRYGDQTGAYRDGALGCAPCAGFGADAAPAAPVAVPTNVMAPVTATVGPSKMVIFGGIVLAAGVLYFVFRKKK